MKGRWIVSATIAFVIAALSLAAAPHFVHAQTPIGKNVYVPGGGDFRFAHPAFQRLWNRLDLPFRERKVDRTWFWGPAPNSIGLLEPYRDDATGITERRVQYFDKS